MGERHGMGKGKRKGSLCFVLCISVLTSSQRESINALLA